MEQFEPEIMIISAESLTWARGKVARRAGDGDSRSSSTAKWRIHSAQSSCAPATIQFEVQDLLILIDIDYEKIKT